MAYTDNKATPNKLIVGRFDDGHKELSFESAFWCEDASVLIKIGDASALITRKQLQEVCTLFPFKEKLGK